MPRDPARCIPPLIILALLFAGLSGCIGDRPLPNGYRIAHPTGDADHVFDMLGERIVTEEHESVRRHAARGDLVFGELDFRNGRGRPSKPWFLLDTSRHASARFATREELHAALLAKGVSGGASFGAPRPIWVALMLLVFAGTLGWLIRRAFQRPPA